MEYISYGENDRYMTRTLEEYANSFCSEMGFKRITDKGIFKVLRYCEDKIMCYRFIDETLKKDLENQDLLNENGGSERFLVSANPNEFKIAAKMFYELKNTPELIEFATV